MFGECQPCVAICKLSLKLLRLNVRLGLSNNFLHQRYTRTDFDCMTILRKFVNTSHMLLFVKYLKNSLQ
jgi:hypothetical protein